MRKYARMTRPCLLPLFLLLATHVSAMEPAEPKASTSNEAARQQKKFLHPHAVHLNVMAHDFPEVSVEEVMDWTGLVKKLQVRPPMLPLDAASEMMISSLSPADLSHEEKRVIVCALNRVMDAQTATVDGKKDDADERRWLARENITTVLPQIREKKQGEMFGKITCGTCHETQTKMIAEYLKKHGLTTLNEKTILDCFTLAIAGKKGFGECEDLAGIFKKTQIKPYGPLKNFVQRQRRESELPLFTALRHESPHTFKPMLKKLVCVQCHAPGRKVERIPGPDGKMKDVPLFYGAGSGSHKHDDHAQRGN